MAAVSPSSWLSHMGCGQKNDLLSGPRVIRLFSYSAALPLLNVSPSASAVRLCPSSDRTTACRRGPGPGHTVRLRPATTRRHARVKHTISMTSYLYICLFVCMLDPVCRSLHSVTFHEEIKLNVFFFLLVETSPYPCGGDTPYRRPMLLLHFGQRYDGFSYCIFGDSGPSI